MKAIILVGFSEHERLGLMKSLAMVSAGAALIHADTRIQEFLPELHEAEVKLRGGMLDLFSGIASDCFREAQLKGEQVSPIREIELKEAEKRTWAQRQGKKRKW